MYPGGYAGGPPPATNGWAIGALIVGILGLLACWVPFVGVPAPVAAVVLGIVGLRRAKAVNTGRAMALAGLIIGAVALLVAVVVTVVVTVFVSNHRHLLDCGSNNLTPAQQQQCVRQELGLPSIAPS